MRFHKAKPISKVEADIIVETGDSSLNPHCVLSCHNSYYDIRSMDQREVDDFMDDLLRKHEVESAAMMVPH